jgi:hypothetical protein
MSALRAAGILILSALLPAALAWVLLAAFDGEWSSIRFAAWCAAMAPVSASTFHLFRLDEKCEPLQYKWRQLKQGAAALCVALVAGYLFEDGVPIMALEALGSTTLSYSLLHYGAMALTQRPSNTSLERTRER